MNLSSLRQSRATLVLLTAAAVWLPTVAPAAPPVASMMDQAAADAEVVLLVPSMSRLSEKVAAFGKDSGLSTYAPEFDDVLGAFKRQMGFLEGVDDDGPMLVVITDLAEAIDAQLDDNPDNDNTEPVATMLVPTANYAGFVQQLGGEPGADAAAIQLGGGSDGFVRQLDGYAVLGQTVEQVQNYTPAKQGQAMTADLGKLVEGYLAKGDSVVYFDIRKLAPSFNKGLDRAMAEADRAMKQPGNQMDPSWAGMTDSMMKLYGNSLHTLIDGTGKLVLSLDIDQSGLGLTSAGKLVEGSDPAGFFKKPAGDGDSKAASLLGSLPEQPYIYAAAIDAQGFEMAKLVNAVMAALDPPAGNDNGAMAGFLNMYRDSLGLLEQAKGVASVFYAPEAAAMMSGGFFSTLTVYDVDDPAGFIAKQKQAFEKLGEMKMDLPAAQEGQPAQPLTFTSRYTPKAMVIDGVDVDQFQVKMNMPPEIVQQMGMAAMFMGNASYGGYIANKDGKVIVTTVTDPQMITRGIKAIGADGGIGTAGTLAELRQNALPPDPMMEAYFSVAGVVQTVQPFMMMFAADAPPIVVPDNLPPIAFGGAARDDGLALRTYIPTDLVRFIVDTYEQFNPQDPNAPGPGGPRRAPRAY